MSRKETVVPVTFEADASDLVALPMETTDRLDEVARSMDRLESQRDERLAQIGHIVQGLRARLVAVQNRVRAFQWERAPREVVMVEELFNEDHGTGTLDRDPLFGALHLPVTSFQSANARVRSVWIDPDSPGLPGNNSVVESVRFDEGRPIVTLVGQTDPHGHILALFDGSPDSWMEWELVAVPPRQKLRQVGDVMFIRDNGGSEQDVREATAGKGWTVYVGLPGREELQVRPLVIFSEEQELPEPVWMRMELEFDPTDGMWLELLTQAIGGRSIFIRELAVSTNGSDWRYLADPHHPVRLDRSVGAWRWYIGGVRFVRMTLQSGGWYRPTNGIGHPFRAVYYRETRRRSLFGFISLGSSTRRWWERVEPPAVAVGSLTTSNQFVARVVGGVVGYVTGISMKLLTQALGAKIVEALGAVAGPVGFILGAIVLGGLYREKVERSVETVLDGVDVFDGFRSAIGVRELRLVERQYGSAGSWVSPIYRLQKPVDLLTIHLHADIPDGTEVVVRWKLDDGDWQSVTPDQWVHVDGVQSVQVGIEMRSSSDTRSPVVYSFVLEGRG